MPSVKQLILDFQARTTDAERALLEVSAGLSKVDGAEAKAQLILTGKKEFDAQLALAEAELQAFSKKRITFKLRATVEDAGLELARLRAEADRIQQVLTPRKGAVPFRNRDIDVAGRIMRSVAGDADKLANSLDGMAQSGDGGTKALAKTGRGLSRISPIFQGLAIVIGVSMVSALAAVAASFAAAVGGMLAMGTALVASLGPAVIVAVALFQRLAAVFQVLSLRRKENDAAAKKDVQGIDDAAAKADREAAAQRAVRDALQGVTRARRDYARAVRDATKEIANALASVKDDQRSLIEALRDERTAHKDVGKARKEAYKAWADAIQHVKDAQLDLEGANLDVRSAQDEVSDAQRAMNKLFEQIPDDKIGQVLTKLQDVNLDPDQVKAFINAAAGKGASSDFGDKLYDAQTRLLRAQHALKVANEAVKKSQDDLTDAQRVAALGVKKFVAQYGPLLDAIEQEHNASLRTAKARRDLAKSEREYQLLQRQGVRGSDAVINAMDGMRDATERLADARKDAAKAGRNVGGSAGISPQAATADVQFAKLSAAEKKLLKALERGAKNFRRAMQPITDAIIGPLAGAIDGVSGAMGQAMPLFRLFGATLGHSLSSIFKEMGKPVWQAFFAQMILLATALTKTATPGFIALLNVFRKIASAAAPALLALFAGITGQLQKFDKSTENASGLNATIKLLVGSTRAWFRLFGALGRVFGAFIKVAAPFGNEFVGFLERGANALADWMKSEKGRKEIAAFFRDTLPVAKAMVKFLGAVLVLFLRVFQALAPLLTGMLDGFTAVIKVFSWGIGIIAKITNHFRKLFYVLGYVVALLLSPGGFAKGFAKLGEFGLKAIRPIIGLVKLLGRGLRGLGGVFGGFFRLAEHAGFSVIRGFGRALAGLGKAFVRFFRNAWNAVLGFFGIRSPSKLAEDAGKEVLRGFVNGFKLLGSLVKGLASWLWKTLKSAVVGAASFILDIGKYAIGKIVDGARAVAQPLIDAGSWAASQISNGFRAAQDFLGLGGKVLGDVQGGVADNAGAFVATGGGIAAAVGAGLGDGIRRINVNKAMTDVLGGLGKLASGANFTPTIKPRFIILKAVKSGLNNFIAGLKNIPLHPTVRPRLIITKAVRDGINALLGAIRSMEPAVTKMGRAASKAAQDVGNAFKKIGGQITPRSVPASATRFNLRSAVATAVPNIASIPVPSFAGAGESGNRYYDQTFNIPPPPSGGSIDPKTTAALLAQEARRRGGFA